MKILKKNQPLLFMLAAMLFVACRNMSTAPMHTSELQFTEMVNVVWTLKNCTIAGKEMDLHPYKPFHLGYGKEEYFGDDGCNGFMGTYAVRNDSLFPKSGGMTMMSCDGNTFSILPLISPYKTHISKDELTIFRRDTSYIYFSSFTKSPVDNPIAGKIWALVASNDPEFESLESLGALPRIFFHEDRRFNIKWYCVDGNIFECNEYQGVFGIGEENTILFYRRGSSVAGNVGLRFVLNIMATSAYETNAEKLVLFHTGDGSTYEFIVE